MTSSSYSSKAASLSSHPKRRKSWHPSSQPLSSRVEGRSDKVHLALKQGPTPSGSTESLASELGVLFHYFPKYRTTTAGPLT
jgi:hypothetical protein